MICGAAIFAGADHDVNADRNDDRLEGGVFRFTVGDNSVSDETQQEITLTSHAKLGTLESRSDRALIHILTQQHIPLCMVCLQVNNLGHNAHPLTHLLHPTSQQQSVPCDRLSSKS